ncbi:hypothetical protein AHFPHNDE_02103 [Pseudomonas sp. MM227]|nr:hypothetical protein AHFPHNDE_02103 [Pseudomonas sp. MM227]
MAKADPWLAEPTLLWRLQDAALRIMYIMLNYVFVLSCTQLSNVTSADFALSWLSANRQLLPTGSSFGVQIVSRHRSESSTFYANALRD